jgi:hypothetical protein
MRERITNSGCFHSWALKNLNEKLDLFETYVSHKHSAGLLTDSVDHFMLKHHLIAEWLPTLL